MTMFPKIEGIYALLDDCPTRCAVHEFRESLYVNTGSLLRPLTQQDDGAFHDDDARRWTIVGPLATDFDQKIEGILADHTPADAADIAMFNRAIDAAKKRLDGLNDAAPSAPDGWQPALEAYDAGLLNDFGGGDVSWWQDYIRAELARAHDFYAEQWGAAK